MKRDATKNEILLRVSGSRIETGSGRQVTLRGVGLGGWMNMENFITGFPATESLQRKALKKALGEEGYGRFFDRFLDVFFTDADAALIASLGMNCVRLPLNYRHFEDDMAPFELKEEGFAPLDRAIDRCARHGLYAIVDLHALPGCQNQHWHSDNPTHWAHFWTHKHFQDRAINLWQEIARRYRDNPWIAGYDPVNEPSEISGEAIWPFYQRFHEAIRGIDEDRILFLEGNRYSTEFGIFGEVWPNTVYACHDYALAGFAYGGDYPGETRGEYVDRAFVESQFRRRSAFAREAGTPIWVGEFGPVYTGDGRRDEMRYRLLQDQLEIYAEAGASWSLWTYKDLGLQGLVNAASDSPYARLIGPVLEKKARLGVDAWGSTDEGVRQIMGPLEELFEHEFPDFQPLPWGRQSWIEVLVRHILLAEPLVDDFERLFEGVSGEEIDELADSFRLDRCAKRERLLEIIEKACGTVEAGEEA